MELRTFTWSYASDTIGGMGKAGKALKQVLETYSISQNRLAVTMGISRSTVNQWVHEVSDPLAEAVTEIIKALRQMDEAAAEEFINLYLERNSQNDDS
jgi:transcriptional regulator with XRE-family HTH domain